MDNYYILELDTDDKDMYAIIDRRTDKKVDALPVRAWAEEALFCLNDMDERLKNIYDSRG
jgi:hypothetical protein